MRDPSPFPCFCLHEPVYLHLSVLLFFFLVAHSNLYFYSKLSLLLFLLPLLAGRGLERLEATFDLLRAHFEHIGKSHITSHHTIYDHLLSFLSPTEPFQLH